MLFAIYLKARFLTNFRTFSPFYQYQSKSDVTKINISQKNYYWSSSNFHRVCQINVRENVQKPVAEVQEKGVLFVPICQSVGGYSWSEQKKSEKPTGYKMLENKKKLKSNGGLESALERTQHES